MNQHIKSPEDMESALQPRRFTAEKKPTGLLSLWYRLTSPPEPSQTASFSERELFRRGRTGSQITIALFFLIFVSFPAAFAGSNSLLVTILIANIFVLALALFLNRLGRVNAAGILVVISVMAGGPTINILTTPGGINTTVLPIFSLLVLPLMCAVSFLPPAWVFVVAAINSLFTFFVLTSLPSSGELHHVLQTSLPGIVTPIVLSQVIVAVVAYITARNARQAIFRADRAEEIASLEQREIERQQGEIEQKQQLDVEIQRILQTHVQVANGNFAARAPLGKENVLWQIAYSLNNLLARLQSYGQMANHYQQLQEENYQLHNTLQSNSSAQRELQRTQEAASRLIDLLRQSKDGHISSTALRSGTVIDAVATQLSASGVSRLTSEPGQTISQQNRRTVIPQRVREDIN
ncbi:MAG TPA: hypothetical protein DHW02_11640 [Ktedonobacter sp.]|nr:hypothetical protein [Ktedonobacter sp.]